MPRKMHLAIPIRSAQGVCRTKMDLNGDKSGSAEPLLSPTRPIFDVQCPRLFLKAMSWCFLVCGDMEQPLHLLKTIKGGLLPSQIDHQVLNTPPKKMQCSIPKAMSCLGQRLEQGEGEEQFREAPGVSAVFSDLVPLWMLASSSMSKLVFMILVLHSTIA